MDDEIPLTLFSHKSGCGSKLSSTILNALLGEASMAREFPDLLVGYDTMDDAAVYQTGPHQALVATADFLTPIVNDPFQFGKIAAASALSDVYAMGGQPTLALALIGYPGLLVPVSVARKILAGGIAMCKHAGIPVCGGHSIDSPELFYGLSVIGTVHPNAVVRNSTAKPGDAIVLAKGLGMGVFGEAIRLGVLEPTAYEVMLKSGTQLNDINVVLDAVNGIHAMTDVSGFGLVGHITEMAKASNLSVQIEIAKIPILPEVSTFAKNGLFTNAGNRNFDTYQEFVVTTKQRKNWKYKLLFEPETNGGLLISVDPGSAKELIHLLHDYGFEQAALIGEFNCGSPIVRIC